jgi:predicted transcriptional regulator
MSGVMPPHPPTELMAFRVPRDLARALRTRAARRRQALTSVAIQALRRELAVELAEQNPQIEIEEEKPKDKSA